MMKRRTLLIGILLAWMALPLMNLGKGGVADAQDELIFPSKPKPVEGWRIPGRPAEDGGAILPQTPRVEEISPLSPLENTPQKLFGEAPKSEVLPPEEPPPVDASVPWEDLLAMTLRPVVLPTSRYLSIGGEGVSLREGPGLDFPRVGTLYTGDVVSHLDTDDDWYLIVDSAGTEGWVSSRYASFVNQAASIVVAERVTLRDAPSIESRVLGSLYRGAIVTADNPVGDWVEIRTPNLEKAYVSKDFVRQLPPQYSPNLPLVEATTATVTSFASVVHEATAGTQYILAVGGDEWVKGGKIGLLHFSLQAPALLTDPERHPPHFVDGVFFEKTVLKRDFASAFSEKSRFPEGTESIAVAYLRGKKKDGIWVFGFTFAGHSPEGRFALVCQEGLRTGDYQILDDQ